jgi:hypothetical protein
MRIAQYEIGDPYFVIGKPILLHRMSGRIGAFKKIDCGDRELRCLLRHITLNEKEISDGRVMRDLAPGTVNESFTSSETII